jgi:hypothetical protein
MSSDQFGNILEGLGKLLNITDLQPDANNCCLLNFSNGVPVSIEVYKGLFLMIISDLGPTPAGKYRENLLGEALKANGQPLPRMGVFGYNKKRDSLLLFEKFFFDTASAEKIFEILPQFIEKGFVWKEAITKGEIPTTSSSSAKPSGMFGLAR